MAADSVSALARHVGLELNLRKVMDRQTAPPPSSRVVDDALVRLGTVGASRLFAAALDAVRLHRVEDAATLFYVGRIRMALDEARFLPKDRGADSPLAYLRAVSDILEGTIHPALTVRPEAFARATERVKAVELKNDDAYRPEWDVALERREGKWRPAQEQRRAGILDRLQGERASLAHRQYLACARVASQPDPRVPPGVAAERMERAARILELVRTPTSLGSASATDALLCDDRGYDPDWIPALPDPASPGVLLSSFRFDPPE